MESARETAGKVVWRPLRELDLAAVPACVHELICETGSLTRALRRLCGREELRLRVVAERPVASKVARVREVVMSCGATPWVFAQTVIPARTLRRNPWLGQMGARPLGDALFDRPDTERAELRFGHLPGDDPLTVRALEEAGLDAAMGPLWARRSDIHIRNEGLTINEVFLPDLA